MSWIQTLSGTKFDFTDIKEESFEISDIALSLSHICRYNGHVRNFYSVAQHCCIVSDLCPDELKFDGLMHDRAEAYTGDIVGPFKRLISDTIKPYENIIDEVSAKKFGLRYPMPEEVHHIDMQVLFAEKRELFGKDYALSWEGEGTIKPADVTISPWGPQKSLYEFMKRFDQLCPDEVKVRA